MQILQWPGMFVVSASHALRMTTRSKKTSRPTIKTGAIESLVRSLQSIKFTAAGEIIPICVGASFCFGTFVTFLWTQLFHVHAGDVGLSSTDLVFVGVLAVVVPTALWVLGRDVANRIEDAKPANLKAVVILLLGNLLTFLFFWFGPRPLTYFPISFFSALYCRLIWRRNEGRRKNPNVFGLQVLRGAIAFSCAMFALFCIGIDAWRVQSGGSSAILPMATTSLAHPVLSAEAEIGIFNGSLSSHDSSCFLAFSASSGITHLWGPVDSRTPKVWRIATDQFVGSPCTTRPKRSRLVW